MNLGTYWRRDKDLLTLRNPPLTHGAAREEANTKSTQFHNGTKGVCCCYQWNWEREEHINEATHRMYDVTSGSLQTKGNV